jgi:hypothetical protein
MDWETQTAVNLSALWLQTGRWATMTHWVSYHCRPHLHRDTLQQLPLPGTDGALYIQQ